MKTILVTGAKGFIGANVLRLLAERDDVVVHATTRATDQADPGPVHWHAVDLLDHTATAAVIQRIRPTHLLHLAWDVRPGKFWTSRLNLEWLGASTKLFTAFMEHGGERFIGAGTCAEYDWSYNRLVEGITPYTPSTLYGTVKSGLRMSLSAAAEQFGLSFAWGHVFLLYGPAERPGRLVSDVIASCLRGEVIPTSEGYQLRDFLHVEDVARAFVALIDSDVQGAVNVSSGEALPVRRIIETIARLTGGEELIRFGDRPIEAHEPMCIVGDSTRLRQEVGVDLLHSLESGLADCVRWWEDNAPD